MEEVNIILNIFLVFCWFSVLSLIFKFVVILGVIVFLGGGDFEFILFLFLRIFIFNIIYCFLVCFFEISGGWCRYVVG